MGWQSTWLLLAIQGGLVEGLPTPTESQTSALSAVQPVSLPATGNASAIQEIMSDDNSTESVPPDRKPEEPEDVGSEDVAGFFVNVSDLIESPDNPRQRYSGLAVTDYDRDGMFELFAAGFGSRNLLLKLDNTTNTLIDVAKDTIIEDNGGFAVSAASCDVNGDGKEELFVHNADAKEGLKSSNVCDKLYKKGKSGWVNMIESECKAGYNGPAGRSVGCMDRYGEGKYGVVVSGYGAPMRLLEFGPFIVKDPVTGEQRKRMRTMDVTADAGLARPPAKTFVQSFLAAPFVSAGRTDLLVGNDKGPNWFFENIGNGRFRETSDKLVNGSGVGSIKDPTNDPRGMAVFDQDGDGLLDVLVTNWNDDINISAWDSCKPLPPQRDTPHRLFSHMELVGDVHKFIDEANTIMPEYTEISRAKGVVVADFDNDGLDEIFVHNMACDQNDQPNVLFARWGAAGKYIKVAIGSAAEKKGRAMSAAVGDFDGDGVLELVLSHGGTAKQKLSVHKANPEKTRGNRWLRVLAITESGAPARGSLVALKEKSGRTQYKVIDNGGGYLTQHEPVAHFGLGTEAVVESVTVTFPDGRVVTEVPDALNKLLVVDWGDKEDKGPGDGLNLKGFVPKCKPGVASC